jgi:hypothetical protein
MAQLDRLRVRDGHISHLHQSRTGLKPSGVNGYVRPRGTDRFRAWEGCLHTRHARWTRGLP